MSEPEHARVRSASRVIPYLGWAALALVGAAVVWIVVTGLLARSRLTTVRAELPKLRAALTSGDAAQARSLADRIAGETRSAHRLTTGPAWWVAANLPVVGSPLRTTRVLAAEVDRVGNGALPGVVQIAQQLSNGSLISGRTIDVSALARLAPTLRTAADSASTASTRVDAAGRSWLPPVAAARDALASDLDRLARELSGARRAVDLAVPMLGQHGVRRYFIGFENEAEARGLGGLPGAFAILTADHGRLTFTHFASDSALDGISAKVDVGADFARRYSSADPTGLFVNSDISPNFPYAAQVWAAMWQQKSGERVDGAIAVDPTALSYFLSVTGPAKLSGGQEVSADNIVALTEKDEYAQFADNAQRKNYLVTVARAVSAQLMSGAGDSTALLRAASRAAGERRLVLWSADPRDERSLAATAYGGVVQGGHGPFSGFAVVNAAGTKLDYYLDRAMTYRRTGCGAGSTAVATLTLRNDAPRQGLPRYVTTRADAAPADARPGDTRLLVTYYATSGAAIPNVTVDGKPQIVATVTENGLETVTVDLELKAGSTHTVRVDVKEPPARTPVTILRQPLVRPLSVATSGDRC